VVATVPADNRRSRRRADRAEPAEPQLGDVLRRARLHHQLSLRDVERRTEIPNAHLSQIERGRIRRPDPSIVFELAQLYRLNYALLAKWAGYVDARVPVDDHLLDAFVRLFASLDPPGQQEALRELERLRDERDRREAT
jgi:transcriptional regulator with XRE-family HTH domain